MLVAPRQESIEPPDAFLSPGPAPMAVLQALAAGPIWFAVFDRELRITFVNDQLAAVSGQSVAAHVGRTLRELLPANPETVDRAEQSIRAVLETGRPATFTVGAHMQGASREWLATYVPVVGTSGAIEGACGIVVELTADREREAAQVRARMEAERMARRLGVLQEMVVALSTARDPAAVARVVVEHARRLADAASARVWMLQERTLELLAASDQERDGVRSIPLDAALPVSAANARRDAVWLEDRRAVEARFPAAAVAGPGEGGVAALPLAADGRRAGVLAFAFDEPRAFDLEERAFLLAIAEHSAQALDRAFLLAAERASREDAQRATTQVERLQAVTAALSRASTVEEVATVLVQSADAVVGARSAVAFVVDRDRSTARLVAAAGLIAVHGPRLEQTPLDQPTPALTSARTGQAFWLESQEAIAASFPDFGERAPFLQPIGALVALPLRSHGEVLGSIGFVFDVERRFSTEDRELLGSIADQCAEALDRARLLETEREARAEAQRLAERLGRLQEITAALSASRTAEDIARTITERVQTVVGAEVSFACVLDEAGEHRLRVLGTRGDGLVHPACSERLPLDRVLPGCRAAATGEPLWLETPGEVRERFPELAATGSGRPRASLVALPLRAAGRLIGSFGFAFDTPRRFDDEERSYFLAIGQQCAVALDRARLVEDERRARLQAEQARAEAERARAEAESARAESERVRSLLDGFVDNAPLGFAILDRDLRYERINATLAAANGLPVEAHLGKTPRELLPGLPMDDIEAALRRVVDTGEPLLDHEIAGETPAGPGRRIWLETWYPVRSGGRTVAIGALVREVTRERHAEEFQRHVMGIVGHDLRNPLSAVLTATGLLERSGLDPVEAKLVARIGAGAHRIEEIVRTLLDFARVRGGGGVPLAPRRCKLGELCRAVAEECRLARPGRRILCEGEGEGAGEWDPDRVAQLLTNLVSNALDHSEDGEPVWIRWRGAEDEVVVEVANAGAPISEELLPRLFEPFRRGDRGRTGGLGLGLFIARAIAVAHGGQIDVRSSVGEGTVFSVRLPR